jgi:predicted AAA+ superfamily ATPase
MSINSIVERPIEAKIISLLDKTPIYLSGARASGKTTILKSLQKKGLLKDLYSFTDRSLVERIKLDYESFFESLKTPVAFDEVQLFPEFLVRLKEEIDSKRITKVIICGSYDVSTNPFFLGKNPLAGRVKKIEVLPFSISEKREEFYNLLPALFDPKKIVEKKLTKIKRSEILSLITDNYLPTFHSNSALAVDDYLLEVLRGQQFTSQVDQLFRIAKIFSAHAPLGISKQKISKEIGISRPTLDSRISVLMDSYLLYEIKSFTNNPNLQELKNTKFLPIDSGFSSFSKKLFNQASEDFSNEDIGLMIELLILNEFKIFISTLLDEKMELSFYRHKNNIEVDMIVENGKKFIGIEIKTKSEINSKDLKGLQFLNEKYEDRFVQGYVFYNGDEVIKLPKQKITYLPLSLLPSPNKIL